MPELRHIIRRLGADSPDGEGRESLISRILLFSPQNWKPDVKIDRAKVEPVTEDVLRKVLKPYISRGMKLKVKDNCWFVSAGKRKDSGTMSMPVAAIERCCRFVMPGVV